MEKKKESLDAPHIIRRKVRVVTTDDSGNEIQKITTKAGSVIQKTKIIQDTEKAKPSYSKEGLGVVRSSHSRNNMANIVVTQNGKKKEELEEKPIKELETKEVEEKSVPEVSKEKETPRYNNQTSQTLRYNNQSSQPPRYNNQSSQQNRPSYNNDRNNNRPPYDPNRSRNNNFSPNRTQNQNGERNLNQPQNNIQKVNKFIKEVQTTEVLQKETRNYAASLIDKRKPIKDRTDLEKREKKNINEMREQNTRMDFSKLKGMQVSEEGLMDLYDRGTNKYISRRKRQSKPIKQTTKIIPLTEVTLPENMTVKYFAENIKKAASEIIKKLFSLGIMANINQEIDFDTAFILAGEYGIKAKLEVVVTEEDKLFDDTEDNEKDLITRSPIVTIMGHVDHGKTSLLDKIRETNVVGKESGGITQHIGAYKVEKNNREITFLDTPGHEAFTEMRARGAQITDIVIIVIAADDSIKPQTKEAIKHAQAADVSIIIAINKIDKADANIEKVKQDLLEHNLCPEEWGGDTICVPVSAKTGEGIENLLEMILLVADVKDLKSNPNKQAKGTVIEAKLDRKKGAIATVLVQRGTLNIGDIIVLGNIVGKVREMINDKGEKIKSAGPSTPVEVLGLGEVPGTGEVFYEVKDEKTANKLIAKRKAKRRTDLIKKTNVVTAEDLYNKIDEGKVKNLDVIIRADVQGSVEALKDSLEKIVNEEAKVRIISCNTGNITESDISLAMISKAILIGFNVKLDSNLKKMADKAKVDLKQYNVIYDAIDYINTKAIGMLKPIYKEVLLGNAEVRNLFKVSSIGTIAGCRVKSGSIVRNKNVRLLRNDKIIVDAKIDSLKREKDDVKDAKEGFDCGIKIEGFNDILEGDILECYEMIEEKRRGIKDC